MDTYYERVLFQPQYLPHHIPLHLLITFSLFITLLEKLSMHKNFACARDRGQTSSQVETAF